MAGKKFAYNKAGERVDGRERLGVFLSKRTIARIKAEADKQGQAIHVRVTMSQVAADVLESHFASR